MLNATTLRTVLKTIYGVEDKFLVPISTNWFIPTIDPTERIGTWIGYRIIDKKPYARAWQDDLYMVTPLKVSFRLSFTGPRAEELADQTLLWEDRADVTKAFESIQTQVNYNSRVSFSYPVRNGGFNDSLSWIVDMTAQTTYEVDTKQQPWFNR